MATVEELAPEVGLAPEVKAAKRLTQQDRVFALLLAAGPMGCTSEELNKVAFRYSAIIFNLRHKMGYDIKKTDRKGTELVRFTLVGHSPVPQGKLL